MLHEVSARWGGRIDRDRAVVKRGWGVGVGWGWEWGVLRPDELITAGWALGAGQPVPECKSLGFLCHRFVFTTGLGMGKAKTEDSSQKGSDMRVCSLV